MLSNALKPMGGRPHLGLSNRKILMKLHYRILASVSGYRKSMAWSLMLYTQEVPGPSEM